MHLLKRMEGITVTKIFAILFIYFLWKQKGLFMVCTLK